MKQTDGTLSQLMFSLIEVWKKSGVTQKEFCAEKNISWGKFQYWMRKYASPYEGTGDFVPVKVQSQDFRAASGAGIEIHWPDGRRVVFHAPVEASFIKALLS